jgi:ring-1,2-phenylacetyl-CoA epoxidase subunit PaaD
MASPLPHGPLALPTPDQAHHAIWALLEAVTDPEIPVVNLREMGVLRAIRQGEHALEVVITPTYSGCPAMDQMHEDIRAALQSAGVLARIVTQLAPAWSSDWITAPGRDKLRAYGIAPPHPNACASQGSLGNPASPSTTANPTSAADATNSHSHIRSNVIAFAPRKGLHPSPPVHCPQCGSDNTTETSHFGSTACKALYRCLHCLEPFDYFKPY